MKAFAPVSLIGTDNTQADFAKLMREDHQRWAKLVKDAGIVLR